MSTIRPLLWLRTRLRPCMSWPSSPRLTALANPAQAVPEGKAMQTKQHK